MTEADERFVLNEDDLDSLYSWIDTVPLSRPKKNIARDFSDGVLVAEIVHHFLPGKVEIHNYIAANAARQKQINWNTLNRKVFTKMDMRLSDKTINSLTTAKSGTIEQVLWDLRLKISDVIANPRTDASKSARHVRPASLSRYSKAERSGYVSNKENDSLKLNRHSASNIGALGNNGNISQGGYVTITGTLTSGLSSQNLVGKAPSESVLKTAKQVEPGDGANTLNTVGSSEVLNNLVNSPPGQIIYRGHKMVPWELVEQREREIKALEQNVKTLNVKSNRLQNLVNLKDERLEDLTHQLHNLRSMYEKVTHNTWEGLVKTD